MKTRNWKRVQPTSLPHAMELSIQYGKEVHNRSVDRIADLMSLANKWSIYKWIENGNMPLRNIGAFEHACGCDFVTRWLAHSAGRLMITIPSGRMTTAQDIQSLQELLNTTVGQLIKFSNAQATPAEVLASITAAMEGLAWHRGNVEKHLQPELEFGGND